MLAPSTEPQAPSDENESKKKGLFRFLRRKKTKTEPKKQLSTDRSPVPTDDRKPEHVTEQEPAKHIKK